SPLRGCASLAPCHPPLLALRAAHSSISTVSYEHPRLLVDCCFFADLCGGPAHPEKSDGIFGDERSAQLSLRFARRYRHSSNDNFLFPDARAASALRPELSLSLSRPERDFHYAADGSGVEGKA